MKKIATKLKNCCIFVNNFFMKKERNLLIVFGILAFFYAWILIFVSEIRQNWLSLALFFMSVYMALKTYFFRSDSSLFLTVFLICLAFLLSVEVVSSFSTFQIGALIAISVSISFLIDYIIFRNVFCFWTFFVNFMTNLPILLYTFNCINLLLMILFLSGEILLLAAAFVMKKYGKI